MAALLFLRFTPVLTTTAYLTYTCTEDMYFRPYLVPSLHEAANNLLPLYMDIWYDRGILLIFTLYSLTWATAIANLPVAHLKDTSWVSFILYLFGLMFSIGHFLWGPRALGLLNSIKKRRGSDGSVELMSAWCRLNYIRGIATDLPAWACFLAAFLVWGNMTTTCVRELRNIWRGVYRSRQLCRPQQLWTLLRVPSSISHMDIVLYPLISSFGAFATESIHSPSRASAQVNGADKDPTSRDPFTAGSTQVTVPDPDNQNPYHSDCTEYVHGEDRGFLPYLTHDLILGFKFISFLKLAASMTATVRAEDEITELDSINDTTNSGHSNDIRDLVNGAPQRAQIINVDHVPDPVSSAVPQEYPTGAKFWFIIISITTALMVIDIDMNIVATAVPSITDHFHTVADVGWYSAVFRLCVCSFQFVFGKAYTLFSVKRVFLLSNAIFIAGCLLCGAAATSRMLIVGRAIAGLGSAGVLSGCLVILAQSVPLRRRPMFLGFIGGMEGVAVVTAPLLGGALTQNLGWRWCFYVNAPIGAATLLLTLGCFSETEKTGDIANMKLKQKIPQLDLVSNLLFLPALTSLFLAFSWAGVKYPWNSGKVIGPLLIFAALLATFIYNQFRRGSAAALPPRVIKRRSVIAGFVFIMCTNGTGNVIEYYLPTYYQIVRGYSPAKSGVMMLPIIVGSAIGALIHGAGTSAFGFYAPFMLFASVVMPIAAGLITTLKVNTSLAKLIIYTALSGLGYGIGFSGPNNAVQTVLPEQDVPLGLSIMLFAQSFGPALAVSIAQVLFTNQLVTNLSDLLPGLSRASVESNGLTEILMSVPPAEVRQLLIGIDKSLIETWYFVVGLACATMLGSLSIEWRSVKSKRA